MSNSQLKYKLSRNAMCLKTKFEWFLKLNFRPEQKNFDQTTFKDVYYNQVIGISSFIIN